MFMWALRIKVDIGYLAADEVCEPVLQTIGPVGGGVPAGHHGGGRLGLAWLGRLRGLALLQGRRREHVLLGWREGILRWRAELSDQMWTKMQGLLILQWAAEKSVPLLAG